MNIEFQEKIAKLPTLLDELLSSRFLTRKNLPSVYKCGVYIFFEGQKPIYVGRSDRIRNRLLEHGRDSSNHNTAPFAFNIAKLEYKKGSGNISLTRKKLQDVPEFAKLFLAAKKRVSEMEIKIIEIKDAILQALFEVYASMELKTEFNDFRNH